MHRKALAFRDARLERMPPHSSGLLSGGAYAAPRKADRDDDRNSAGGFAARPLMTRWSAVLGSSATSLIDDAAHQVPGRAGDDDRCGEADTDNSGRQRGLDTP